MIKKVKGGFQLHSLKDPSRALGPVRSSQSEVGQKDEKRVQFFQNLKKSSGGPGSLAAKIGKSNPDLVKKIGGPKLSAKDPIKAIPGKSNLGTTVQIMPQEGSLSNLPSIQASKARRTKSSQYKGGGK